MRTLRWDLRLLFAAWGYNVGASNGSVSERIKDMRPRLVPFLDMFGFALELPHYGQSYHSMSLRAKRSRQDHVARAEAEQEFWVSSEMVILLNGFMLTYRKGSRARRVAAVVLQGLIGKVCDAGTFPSQSLRDWDPPDDSLCPLPGDVVERCGHVRHAPLPKPQAELETHHAFLCRTFLWVMDSPFITCPNLQAWVVGFANKFSMRASDTVETWGDGALVQDSAWTEKDPGRKRRRRIDVHVRNQLCGERLAASCVESAATLAKTIHGMDAQNTCHALERQHMQDVRAAQVLAAENFGTVGASYDACVFGSPKQDINLGYAWFAHNNLACILAPMVRRA